MLGDDIRRSVAVLDVSQAAKPQHGLASVVVWRRSASKDAYRKESYIVCQSSGIETNPPTRPCDFSLRRHSSLVAVSILFLVRILYLYCPCPHTHCLMIETRETAILWSKQAGSICSPSSWQSWQPPLWHRYSISHLPMRHPRPDSRATWKRSSS